MSEEIIANVTYVNGDTMLGFDRIKVSLVASNIGLIIRRRSDGTNLLTIPWPNIRNYRWGAVAKSTGATIGAWLIRVLTPFGNVSHAADMNESGFSLIYWEEDAQTEQSPFFAVGASLEKPHKVAMEIFQHRDNFVRNLSNSGKPR